MKNQLKTVLWKQYYFNKKYVQKSVGEGPPIESGEKTYFGQVIRQNDVYCCIRLLEFDSPWKIHRILPDEINKLCEVFELSFKWLTFSGIIHIAECVKKKNN